MVPPQTKGRGCDMQCQACEGGIECKGEDRSQKEKVPLGGNL